MTKIRINPIFIKFPVKYDIIQPIIQELVEFAKTLQKEIAKYHRDKQNIMFKMNQMIYLNFI